MDDKECQANHQQILHELDLINKRMDKDWELINASNIDRVRREGIWNVIKWIGYGSITALLLKLLQ